MGQRTNPFDRGIDLGRIADHEAELPIAAGDIADRDAWVAAPQFGADLLLHIDQPLPGDVLGRCLQQQMAAAGKVEPQIDARLHEAGQLRDGRVGQEARHGAQHADQERQEDRGDRPARKVQHDAAQSFAGLAVIGSMTSVSVALTALTFMPGASSTSA